MTIVTRDRRVPIIINIELGHPSCEKVLKTFQLSGIYSGHTLFRQDLRFPTARLGGLYQLRHFTLPRIPF